MASKSYGWDVRNIAKISPKMAKKTVIFRFFDFLTNCSYDSNESESGGKRLKPTPLPHMRLWFVSLFFGLIHKFASVIQIHLFFACQSLVNHFFLFPDENNSTRMSFGSAHHERGTERAPRRVCNFKLRVTSSIMIFPVENAILSNICLLIFLRKLEYYCYDSSSHHFFMTLNKPTIFGV